MRLLACLVKNISDGDADPDLLIFFRKLIPEARCVLFVPLMANFTKPTLEIVKLRLSESFL